MKRLRIAFDFMPPEQWTAGVGYLDNLFVALKHLPDAEQPEIVLLVPPRTDAGRYAVLAPRLAGVIEIPPPASDAWNPFWTRQRIRVAKRLGLRRDPPDPLDQTLIQRGIHAVFAARHFGARLTTPLMGWIVDFQHVHFPDHFSALELGLRDEQFAEIARRSARVVVSSQAVRADFQRFAPALAHKARVLSFAVRVPECVYETEPAWVCGRYGLPRRFAYLPNQFWKHKNHQRVLEALQLVKDRHPEIVVVCSGNTNDYRDPLHLGRLLVEISERGLRDRFILLGLVPSDHMYALMRQSVTVLQPSQFEGWSTSIEEVKSMGKNVVVSDIPVHREQNPPGALYFPPREAASLAECLVSAFRDRCEGPDRPMEEAARNALSQRISAFGRTFMAIALESVQERVRVQEIGA